MHRKFFVLVTLLALLAALTLSAGAQDPVTIRLWSGSSSPVENEALEAQVAAFMEANPDITVELLISPDYDSQLQTAFASGDYPDVFMVGQGNFPAFADSGVLMPAGENIVEQDGIYSSLLAAFTDAEGTVYCPPKDFSTLALLYNKDLFDAAGLEYPTADWTWDDLKEAAATLTQGDVVGMSVAPDFNRWLGFFYANGGSLFDEEGNVVFNSPEGVASLEYYASFVTEGIGATPSALNSGWNGEAFGKAAAAMTIEGNWAIGFLEEGYPDLNWGVAEMPVAPGGERGTLTFTVCWAVGANTPNPEAAWSLVNFLTGPEGAQFVAEAGFGVMPARSAYGETWLETRGEEFAAFVAGADYAVAPIFPLGFGDFTDSLSGNMQAVLDGEVTAQEVMDEAQEIAEEIAAEMME